LCGKGLGPKEELAQIEKLKEVALKTLNSEVKMRTTHALEPYGSIAIPAISEIAEATLNSSVKTYSLRDKKAHLP
jgi:hypothetical protein